MKTTASVETLQKALTLVNRRYKGNIQFERFEPNRRSVNFTLRVARSSGPGARRGFTGRRLAKACWHAHGHFFEAVLKIDPEAQIVSRGGPGAVINRHGGNWQDCNIGSVVNPLFFSQACDCHSI